MVTAAPLPRIAILLGAPLTEQNYQRTGIPYLATHFDVVTFDCLEWLGRSTDGISQDVEAWGTVKRVTSAADLAWVVSEMKPDYAVDFIGRGPTTAETQKVLADAGVRYVVQKTGTLPIAGFLSRLRFLLTRAGSAPAATVGSAGARPAAPPEGRVSRTVCAVAKRIGINATNELAPDVGLLAGRHSLNDFTKRSRQIVWVASQDAHLYARAKAAQDETGAPYILFVDDYLPYATDWTLLGLKPPVTAETYYRSMRRFFDHVEKRLGLPVVVAAHPSSRHDTRLVDGFGGRSVVLGQTPRLVLGSRLVLLHASTAVSFAVLDKKPTIFLTSDELRNAPYGGAIAAMARSVGSPLLNIDVRMAAMRVLAAPQIDRRKYARYVDRYLRTSEATETQAWQAFSEFVFQNHTTTAVDRG